MVTAVAPLQRSRGTTGGRRRSGLFGRRSLLFLIPGAVYLAVLSLYPLLDLARMAFSDVNAGNILGERPWNGLENAKAVLADPTFGTVVLQTLVLVAIVLVLGMAGGFLAALAIRPRTLLSSITLGFMVFVWTLPSVVVGNLWKFLLESGGPINSLLLAVHLVERPVPWLSQNGLALVVLAVVNAWMVVPFCALVMRAALLDIPDELLEAAALDGASGWKLTRFIVLPLLRPVLAILAVLVVINAFRSFDLIFVMTSGGPGKATTTLPFLAYQQAFTFFQFGQGAFTATLALAIVLVFGVAYIRMNRKESAS